MGIKKALRGPVAAACIGAGFLLGGPVGAVTIASAAYSGYKLGKKNASTQEVIETMAITGLSLGVGKIAQAAQPAWMELIKKK
jgi:hypothetical protein